MDFNIAEEWNSAQQLAAQILADFTSTEQLAAL